MPITTCLWFESEAEEAANYYASILPYTRVDRVTRTPVSTPGGPEGTVLLVEFTLLGTPMLGLNGGIKREYTDSMSLSVECADQAELDRYWDALVTDGRGVACGWLRDKYDIPWQIVPKQMNEYLTGEDRAKAARAMTAMFDMVKFDVAKIVEAAEH